MDFDAYKSMLKQKPKLMTLTFLVKNDQILLGLKKKGFGKGLFLGIGGKVKDKENINEAAKREVKEEIGVKALNIKRTAILNFYFPYVKDESWNQQVYVFMCNSWQNEPKETDEIKPQWFNINKIPFDRMWGDSKFWLTKILKGQYLKGEFFFDKNNCAVLQHRLKIIKKAF